MARTNHTWVDELLGEVEEGFKLSKMAKTAGRMILAADKMAQRLCASIDSQADPRELHLLARGLKDTAGALEVYAGIYTWCEQYNVTGNDTGSTLNDLIPLLTKDELSTMQQWLGRIQHQAMMGLQ